MQDADLFLTETDFSPDGDGVRDETSLAYRATGPVTIVVSNAMGRKVRTLAAGAPSSGSVTWDGRGDRGQILGDGVYTLTVEGEGGQTLGNRHRAHAPAHRAPSEDKAVGREACALGERRRSLADGGDQYGRLVG